jgi:AAA domain-containing protein
VLYGDSQTYKSFIALDIGLHVAAGWDWWGRTVEQCAVVYIAAEGAKGVRKRIAGLKIAYRERLKGKRPLLKLISVALNLGTAKDDLRLLIASIEALGIQVGLIIIDTLAQSLGGGDENGAGMTTFVANATALANHFDACVLAIHHIGHGDDRRERGHSSLKGGVDARVFSESNIIQTATVTIQKMKDDASGLSLTVSLKRVVVTQDSKGREVTTLVVSHVVASTGLKIGRPSKRVSKHRLLLTEMVQLAVEEAGQDIHGIGNGPMVRAAKDEAVRTRYYIRVAEKADPGEDPKPLAERQRKSFNRAVEAAVVAKEVMARVEGGERFLWLP